MRSLGLLASNYYDDYYSKEEKGTLLDDIYSSLDERGAWKIKVFLPTLKVPVIRAKYLPWQMDCKFLKFKIFHNAL